MNKIALPERNERFRIDDRIRSLFARRWMRWRNGEEFKYILKFCRVRSARFVRQFKRSRARMLSSFAAGSLNIVLLAIMVAGLRLPSAHEPQEMHLVLAPLTRAETISVPSIPNVDLPVMQMPDIVIERDAADDAPPALAASLVLAPRPDPAHPNPAPTDLPLDGQHRAVGSLVVKILVRPDGTVADAAVVRTSGRSDTDLAAMDFIKAQWKFLPALLEGRPIQYWTTIIVRFA
jgi:TonB family protein